MGTGDRNVLGNRSNPANHVAARILFTPWRWIGSHPAGCGAHCHRLQPAQRTPGTGINHVIRNLHRRFFDRDQRPDLWSPHSSRARAMDLRWHTRLDRSGNLDRRESNAAKRSICMNVATWPSSTKGESQMKPLSWIGIVLVVL